MSAAEDSYQVVNSDRVIRFDPIALDLVSGDANLGSLCGINSAVECQLPKLKVASSNLVSRSKIRWLWLFSAAGYKPTVFIRVKELRSSALRE